jgi:multisubunit Na+/H+ antiporter MnhG subunit
MRHTLIILGVIIVLVGVLWPWLSRLGLGRLPGDIYIRTGHVTFYFPLTTGILVSVVLSLLLWLLSR